MILTQEQQAILNGEKGETLAKVMKTLVMYGDAFEAEKLVPISSKYNHLVTSFGLKVMSPVYDLMQQLLDAGVASEQKFSVDPRPIDKNVPANILQNLVFNKFMYTKQDFYEKQLKDLGLLNNDAFTCTCYMDEVGNKPQKGDVLSWAESSAVVYANSVLGARCNRNSGIIDIMGSIVGYVPYFGLLTDEGRKATWVIKVQTENKPEAQLLGSAIGMKVMEAVPYIKGLDKWLGSELDDAACTYLKDFGAATASNGAVGLYHIDNLTPEAVELGGKLITDEAKVYVIDDAELERVKNNYPVIWKDKDATPKTCLVDSYSQIGKYISIDVALNSDGKAVPYISYFAEGFSGLPKVAYLPEGISDTTEELKPGSDDSTDMFTGTWEVSLIPTSSYVCEDNMNVAVWKKNGVIEKSIAKAVENKTPTTSGTCYGNGTSQFVLGYATEVGVNGFIETAQMK